MIAEDLSLLLYFGGVSLAKMDTLLVLPQLVLFM
jgi:hypothetical protein